VAAEPARVDIAIVAYRCRRLLEACLRSLAPERRSTPLEVVVVDNASGDGTVDAVRAHFPWVDLIAAPTNLGFARATNLAIQRGHAPYVLALNPDTRLPGTALRELVGLMERNGRVAALGPKLVREDGSLDHAARRSFPTPLGAFGHFTGLGRRPASPRALAQYTSPPDTAGPVDAVNGAFMLMRRSALEEVGLFDEGYWMYMEDLDLCYRLARAGWVTWYEPSVEVVHVKAGTSGRFRRPRLNVAFHYGMLRFYRKHYASDRSRLLNASVYVAIGVKLLSSLTWSAVRRR
jgi:N-acetylglucosaminyl-diphospho-decaprenol L-rhamnosyltransferase